MKRGIRAFIIVTAACALMLMGTCVSMAAEQEKIGTYDQLKTFIDGINDGTIDAHQDAILTKDIVVPETVGNDWVPLAKDQAHMYQGTFDGQGHTISGIKIERNDPKAYPDPWNGKVVINDYTAFISFLGEEGVVKKLTLEADISDVNFAAGLVSQNRGTIQDCSFKGTLRSEIYPHGGEFDDCAGAVGCIAAVNAGTIDNCQTMNESSVSRGGTCAGGIAGEQISGGVIKDCTNRAYVSARETIYQVEGVFIGGIGGIVGGQEMLEPNSQAALNESVGMFFESKDGQVPEAAAIVRQDNSKAADNGTRAGEAENTTGQGQPLVEGCINEGAVSATQVVGGICGLATPGIIRNCTNHANIENVDSGRAGGIAGYFGAVENLTAEIIDCANDGDINTDMDSDKRGDYIGGIVGWALDYIPELRIHKQIPVKISNCRNNGHVCGKALVGGVLGLIQNGMFDVDGHKETFVYQLVNLGQVDGQNYVGGIAGACPGVMADTINYGGVKAVLGKDSKKNGCIIGGIAGSASDTGRISDSYNMGYVSVKDLGKIPYDAGGIVGLTVDTLSGCYFCMDTSGEVKAANGSDTNDLKGLLTIQEMTGDAPKTSMKDLMDPQSGDHYGTVWSCKPDETAGGVTYGMTPQFDGVAFSLEEIKDKADLAKKDWTSLENAVVTSEKESYVYTGKEITPKVQVTLGDAVLMPDKDYVVYGAYHNVKGGVASVLVLGKGDYCGTAFANFEIVPAKAGLKSVKAGKKSITVTMTKTAAKCGGKRYEVQYRVKGSAKWKSVTTVKKSVTIKKLKKGKKYQVRARAFTTFSSGKIYGKWSGTKTSGKVK